MAKPVAEAEKDVFMPCPNCGVPFYTVCSECHVTRTDIPREIVESYAMIECGECHERFSIRPIKQDIVYDLVPVDSSSLIDTDPDPIDKV